MDHDIKAPSDLVGEEVSAISFVRDYVEIHFDGPILRSLTDPIIAIEDSLYRFPKEGARDALCRMVGSTVLAVAMDEGRALELTTNNGCVLTIRLDEERPPWGESMHFVPRPNAPLLVW